MNKNLFSLALACLFSMHGWWPEILDFSIQFKKKCFFSINNRLIIDIYISVFVSYTVVGILNPLVF